MGKKAHGEFESACPGYCGAPWASPWHLPIRPWGGILNKSPQSRPGLASKGEAPGHLLRGNAKGVRRIDQQTFIDRYSKVTFATLYDRKTRLAAADLLNDRVLPFFEECEIALSGPRLPQ
jgi:hypothetical protein